MTRVFVGMSGGVDSSLAASLLVEQGYDVTGVYMKNWSQDLPGMRCPWAEDLADAKRVAVQLGIDFKVYDFEAEYRDKVVQYMIDEYRLGRTPNPDVMCNQEVKFRLFLDTALEDGAEMIATGHYARVLLDKVAADGHPDADQTLIDGPAGEERVSPEADGALDQERSRDRPGCLQPGPRLALAVDGNKDQTYFLYRVTAEALAKTLFPLGGYTKLEVRQMAEQRGLLTAGKKDSQGICFVGEVGIREFLSQYVQTTPGEIVDSRSGEVLGHHDGAIFYTLGQRHGLNLGGGLPYYVTGKNMDKNEVYVSTNLNDETFWKDELTLGSAHWIGSKAPQAGEYQARVRHRAPLVDVKLSLGGDGSVVLNFSNPERVVAPGQSVVIYDDVVCLGGGIVSSSQ